MARVEVGKGRGRVERVPAGLRITIPAKKNLLLIAFLAFWLVGWTIGEITAIFFVLIPEMSAHTLFVMTWLVPWTIGGALAIYVWLWNVTGKEIILISENELQHIRQLPIFRRSKEYDLAAVSNLRVQAGSARIFSMAHGLEFWGIAGGTVVFDYGRSTHRFGAQLEEADAEHIVGEIRKQFTHL